MTANFPGIVNNQECLLFVPFLTSDISSAFAEPLDKHNKPQAI